MNYPLSFREVDKPTFDRIERGEKTIETRAGMPEYLKFKVGDVLDISCGENHISKTIEEVLRFDSPEQLLEKFSPDEIMPEGTTKEEAIAKWNSFPNYPERIKHYGIIAWRLK